MKYEWQEIIFDGELGELFGSTRKWRVRNMADIIAMADAVYKDFRKYFSDKWYHIFVGDHLLSRNEVLSNVHIYQGPVRITPAIQGAGWADVLTAVIGVAMIALAVFNPTFLGTMSTLTRVMLGVTGAAMVAGGAAGIVSNTVQSNDDRGDGATSFVFQGPTLRMKPGNPVPIVLGQGYVGATRVMERIVAEEMEKIA